MRSAGTVPARMTMLTAALLSALTVLPAVGQDGPSGGGGEVVVVGNIAPISAPVRGDSVVSDGLLTAPQTASNYRWCPSAGRSASLDAVAPTPTPGPVTRCGDAWTSRLQSTPSYRGAAWASAPRATSGLASGTADHGAFSVDLAVANAIRNSGVQENAAVRALSTTFRRASIPGTLLLAAALYGIGELDDRPYLADLGLNTGRAVVGAGAVTLAGKIAAGRARPHIAPDDPADFSGGRGFFSDDYQAFPSAHSAAAFAAVTVLAADLADRHPGTGSWIYPTMYSAAAMAALSRIIDEEHWLTDTLAGGLIGVLGGLLVNDRYAPETPTGAR